MLEPIAYNLVVKDGTNTQIQIHKYKYKNGFSKKKRGNNKEHIKKSKKVIHELILEDYKINNKSIQYILEKIYMNRDIYIVDDFYR